MCHNLVHSKQNTIFLSTELTFTDKLAWDSLVLVVLSQVIKLSTLDRGCIDFSCVLKGEIKKMGTLKKMGTPKTEKRFPWGPTWPQWIGTRTTVEVGGWMDMTAAQYKGKYLCVHKNHTLCMMGFFYTIRKRMYNTWGSWLGQNGLKKIV